MEYAIINEIYNCTTYYQDDVEFGFALDDICDSLAYKGFKFKLDFDDNYTKCYIRNK